MRITENLLTGSFLSQSARALARMAEAQSKISSGRGFLRPSDDPRALLKSLTLRSNLRRVDAFRDNASAATATMSLTESALSEVSELLSRAKELLVGAANATGEGTGNDARVTELRGLIDSILLVANRDVGGRRLFGGHETIANPYFKAGNRVVYAGDAGTFYEELGPGLRVAVNLTGPEAFQTVAARILGTTDLDPAVSTITPLADLIGGAGVSTGHIRITDSNGVAAEIDLLGAQNLGDVIDGINTAGLSVVATLSSDGKTIELTDTGGGPSLQVEDLFEGSLAQDLGLAGTSDTGSIVGLDLNPAITERTPMSLLRQGSGIGPGLWTLRNDGATVVREAQIDPSAANTVGDLLDLIEGATTPEGVSLGLRARVDGTGLVIESKRLHTTISVLDDGGGTSARDLGLATVAEARDVFTLLEDAAAAVESESHDGIDRMILEMTRAIEETAGVRGSYGARSRQVLNLAAHLDDQKVDLTIRLGDVEDADLAEAAIELTQAETIYNATLASGARLLNLNLFNFIR